MITASKYSSKYVLQNDDYTLETEKKFFGGLMWLQPDIWRTN